MTTATRSRCRHCGSHLIIPDGEGGSFCLLCGRPYTDWQKYGALGGQATLARYGREHMVELGKRGGRPSLRQLPTFEINKEESRHAVLNINSLKELKRLYAVKLQRTL